MIQYIDAIYEDGVFRPVYMPAHPLAEGQHVRIVIDAVSPQDSLSLAVRVYEGLSEEDVKDVERIALDRSNFFTGSTE